MISKELLSAVLEEKVIDIILLANEYELENNIFKSLPSIYELAYMCKEWAYSQGYILFSKIRLNSSLASCYFDTMGKHDYEDGYHNDFRAETESEAIFKACQWILDKDSK